MGEHISALVGRLVVCIAFVGRVVECRMVDKVVVEMMVVDKMGWYFGRVNFD